MVYLLRQLWAGLTWLFGLIFPMLVQARDYRRWAPRLRWPLHVVVIALILAGLTYLNHVFDLEQILLTPLPILRKVWLPLLFLLVYVNGWLGWWLWQLLGPDQEGSDFPDIDQAWHEAAEALQREGIDLRHVPLFLILGRSAGGEEALFHAAQLEVPLRHIPRRADAPLHLYANAEGIYLTCAGACLLGRQSAILAEAVKAEPTPRREHEEPAIRGPRPPAEAASSAGPLSGAKTLLRPRTAEPPGGGDGPTRSSKETAVLYAEDEIEPATDGDRRPVSLLKNSAEVEELTARLKHLCRLIARDRRPYCPVNGLVVLLPFAATASDALTEQTAALCQIDLTTVRDVLQVECPRFVLVCDLEQAPGCRELVERFPEEKRERRVGRRLPYVPNLAAAPAHSMIEDGVRWICTGLIPPAVFRLMRATPRGREDHAAVVRGNLRLYRFMDVMRERQKRLARLLVRATVETARGPLRLTAFYLGGTGRDAEREQAFVAGVLRQLPEFQNFVAWTPEALAEEADYKWWTRVGYAALGLFVLTVVVLLSFL